MKKCKYCMKVLPKRFPSKDSDFCNRSCYVSYNKHKKTLFNKKNKLKQFLDDKGFFINKKEKYNDKIINYDSSPTGKAYIGINKEPLMPNKNAYGFEGVVLQDDSRQFIQCSSCGEWFKKIQNTHTLKCCGLTIKEYKDKFGLFQGQGLVSDETSLKLTKSALKNKENQKKFAKKYAGTNLNKNIGVIRHKQTTGTRQWQNKHGTCPAQLKSRLKEFILNNREFPNTHNRGSAIYKSLCKTFGNFNNAMKKYGLPTRKRVGTNIKLTFPDYTVFSYNINRIGDREELFEKLVEKCKLLSS